MREGPYIGRRDDLGVCARVWMAGERLGGDRGVRLREGVDGPDSGDRGVRLREGEDARGKAEAEQASLLGKKGRWENGWAEEAC